MKTPDYKFIAENFSKVQEINNVPNGTFADSDCPWDSHVSLLESIVYRLEQEWNGNYDVIREAFEPYIEKIYEYLNNHST